MSFRLEKKYKLSIYDFIKLKSNLIKTGMSKLYPSRVINSTYYDNENLEMYSDSEEGLLPRKKVRIRWYNETERFFYEVKNSSFEGRFKKTKDFVKNVDNEKLFVDKDYGLIFPSLMITYEREYFKLFNLRLTFDKNIKYKNLRFSQKKMLDSERVMEIKSNDLSAIENINYLVKNPDSRFSKYCRGLQLTNSKI